MMSLSLWLAFIAASSVLLIIPGPTILTVISYSIAHGRRANLPLIAGVALGDSTALALALLGLGALLATSAWWFTLIKWAGGLYLIWLGARMLLARGQSLGSASAPIAFSGWRLFANTWLVTALNPKGMIFFVAFLPQFVDPARGNAAAQTALLGTLFAAQTVLIFGALGWYAGTVGGWLRGRPAVGRWLDRATGVLFIGLGIRLALAERG